MSSDYEIAPIFLVRMAGVPFENIERLSTRETSKAARDLLARHQKFAESDTIQLGQILERQLGTARAALLDSAKTCVRPYLIFAAEGVRERLTHFLTKLEGLPLPERRKEHRATERALLLYLQRISAKNDSLSRFGPCAWGKVEGRTRLLTITPQPGIAKCEAFVERWAAHGIAAAMNADPSVRPELFPRVDPNGRVEGDQFLFADTGERMNLDGQMIKLLAGCDGSTPAYALGAPEMLDQLAGRKIVRWEVEVPALDPHAVDTLLGDVRKWRDGPARSHWLEQLEPLAALPTRFIQASEPATRLQIMDEARRRLQELGSQRATPNRFLYSASNPIGEECFRECGLLIGADLIDEVATEAAPWIDLWRDSYAFIAGRVAAGLRGVIDKMSIPHDAGIALPAFLHACESQKLSLTGPGLVALAHIAFQELKAAFREQIKPHAEKAEYELTAHDCHFVRRKFQYPKFDEYTYPSADLQISAKSIEAVGRGDYRWILAELHPPVALLHHGFYWSCPDKPALHRALASTVNGRPSFHFGIFVADFTASTCVHLIDPMLDLTYFVAPQRGNPQWRTISPAEAEVYVDPASGDVCLRKIGSGEYLGSFARNWIIPLGFHPFQFNMAPHLPRLRCGKVIVQRRTWTVTLDELGAGDFRGVSPDLVLAVERLRARRNLPRHVYIRPAEQALRRSGAEGRDKDTKPVFVDLESYLFLEIFHRWLTKSGELEVAEMLPDADYLLWSESDGRRTFELRTLIVPRL